MLSSVIIVFLFCINGNAQIQTGVKAGANFSWFTNAIDPFAPHSEYYDDYRGFKKHFRIGIHGGFFAIFNNSGPFAFGAEILYSSRGAMHRIKNTNVTLIDNDGEWQSAFDTYTYKLDYLEFPLLIQYNSNTKLNTGFSFYAGVSPAIAVNKKRVYRYYDASGYVTSSDRLKQKKELQHLRNFNLFPLAGVKIGGRNGFGDLRASYPFFPVFNRSKNTDGSNLSTRMWTIGASAGIYF